MNILYRIGIAAYCGAVKVASTWNIKARKMLEGQRDTAARIDSLNRLSESNKTNKRIWIHAASLGEFEQGRPLIEKIREAFPDAIILLSFFSPSGMEVRKDYNKVDMTVYLPFDTKANAQSFIESFAPTMAIFIKYEFWGNYLTELHKRNIPTFLISGIFRKNQCFFMPWGGLFRKMLRCFTHLFLQNLASQQLLRNIGITNTTVTGDTRLDRVIQIMRKTAQNEIINEFAASGEKNILIAGSTWPADETLIFDWLKRNNQYRSIIAPHEFDQQRLKSLLYNLGENAYLLSELQQYRSQNKSIPPGIRHIVIDSFGLLASIYRYAAIAYVGGGFGAGIHNINEAAVYGIPVVFGPNYQKFREATDLINLGAAFPVSSQNDFDNILDKLARDKESRIQAGAIARKYIMDNSGATDRIFTTLFDYDNPQTHLHNYNKHL
ncbi:MAG: 3-deoxy-D-manno-octulosonic acid transferase [Muribaculaceae bacterium]|nr:3-deoxy-D-manno-octulosonic acid transferase [Muribaculaceae bacterium]